MRCGEGETLGIGLIAEAASGHDGLGELATCRELKSSPSIRMGVAEDGTICHGEEGDRDSGEWLLA